MIFGSRLALTVLALGTAMPAAGGELPGRLRCEISGRGSCSAGVCVGGGVRGSRLDLRIAPGSRSVTVDRLKGRIVGDAPLALGEQREIAWPHALVRYTRLTVHRRPVGTKGQGSSFVAHLGDGDRFLEFQCRPA